MLTLKEVERRQAERKAAKETGRIAHNEEARKRNEKHRQNKDVLRARQGARLLLPIENGCALVVSDQHYYPGQEPSTAHRASLVLAKKLRPFAVISNGDAIDGASISRWPVGSFTELKGRPTVAAELKEAAARLADYERLTSPRWLVWNLGNHDARFETRLAEHAPEYAGVNGFSLKDHFGGWLPAWRTDFVAMEHAVPEVIVKHRFKGGEYAANNNSRHAGTSTVTGHDHMLWAKALTDVRGLRWGIDAGTTAPVESRHFLHYTEDNVQNWQSGFVLLHFHGGRFIGPELIYVLSEGRIAFRGAVLKV